MVCFARFPRRAQDAAAILRVTPAPNEALLLQAVDQGGD